MRNDSRVTRAFGHFDRGKCFSQGTNLIDFDQNGIGDLLINALL